MMSYPRTRRLENPTFPSLNKLRDKLGIQRTSAKARESLKSSSPKKMAQVVHGPSLKIPENIFERAKGFVQAVKPMRQDPRPSCTSAQMMRMDAFPLDLTKASRTIKVPSPFKKTKVKTTDDVSLEKDEPLDLTTTRKRNASPETHDVPPVKRFLPSDKIDVDIKGAGGTNDIGASSQKHLPSDKTSIFPKPAHTNSDSVRRGPSPYVAHRLVPVAPLPVTLPGVDGIQGVVSYRGKDVKISPVRPQINGRPVMRSPTKLQPPSCTPSKAAGRLNLSSPATAPSRDKCCSEPILPAKQTASNVIKNRSSPLKVPNIQAELNPLKSNAGKSKAKTLSAPTSRMSENKPSVEQESSPPDNARPLDKCISRLNAMLMQKKPLPALAILNTVSGAPSDENLNTENVIQNSMTNQSPPSSRTFFTHNCLQEAAGSESDTAAELGPTSVDPESVISIEGARSANLDVSTRSPSKAGENPVICSILESPKKNQLPCVAASTQCISAVSGDQDLIQTKSKEDSVTASVNGISVDPSDVVSSFKTVLPGDGIIRKTSVALNIPTFKKRLSVDDTVSENQVGECLADGEDIRKQNLATTCSMNTYAALRERLSQSSLCLVMESNRSSLSERCSKPMSEPLGISVPATSEKTNLSDEEPEHTSPPMPKLSPKMPIYRSDQLTPSPSTDLTSPPPLTLVEQHNETFGGSNDHLGASPVLKGPSMSLPHSLIRKGAPCLTQMSQEIISNCKASIIQDSQNEVCMRASSFCSQRSIIGNESGHKNVFEMIDNAMTSGDLKVLSTSSSLCSNNSIASTSGYEDMDARNMGEVYSVKYHNGSLKATFSKTSPPAKCQASKSVIPKCKLSSYDSIEKSPADSLAAFMPTSCVDLTPISWSVVTTRAGSIGNVCPTVVSNIYNRPCPSKDVADTRYYQATILKQYVPYDKQSDDSQPGSPIKRRASFTKTSSTDSTLPVRSHSLPNSPVHSPESGSHFCDTEEITTSAPAANSRRLPRKCTTSPKPAITSPQKSPSADWKTDLLKHKRQQYRVPEKLIYIPRTLPRGYAKAVQMLKGNSKSYFVKKRPVPLKLLCMQGALSDTTPSPVVPASPAAIPDSTNPLKLKISMENRSPDAFRRSESRCLTKLDLMMRERKLGMRTKARSKSDGNYSSESDVSSRSPLKLKLKIQRQHNSVKAFVAPNAISGEPSATEISYHPQNDGDFSCSSDTQCAANEAVMQVPVTETPDSQEALNPVNNQVALNYRHNISVPKIGVTNSDAQSCALSSTSDEDEGQDQAHLSPVSTPKRQRSTPSVHAILQQKQEQLLNTSCESSESSHKGDTCASDQSGSFSKSMASSSSPSLADPVHDAEEVTLSESSSRPVLKKKRRPRRSLLDELQTSEGYIADKNPTRSPPAKLRLGSDRSDPQSKQLDRVNRRCDKNSKFSGSRKNPITNAISPRRPMSQARISSPKQQLKPRVQTKSCSNESGHAARKICPKQGTVCPLETSTSRSDGPCTRRNSGPTSPVRPCMKGHSSPHSSPTTSASCVRKMDFNPNRNDIEQKITHLKNEQESKTAKLDRNRSPHASTRLADQLKLSGRGMSKNGIHNCLSPSKESGGCSRKGSLADAIKKTLSPGKCSGIKRCEDRSPRRVKEDRRNEQSTPRRSSNVSVPLKSRNSNPSRRSGMVSPTRRSKQTKKAKSKIRKKRSMLDELVNTDGYVAEKRFEKKSDTLFVDPSQLTREERALQRAIMQFTQIEMKSARAGTEQQSSKKTKNTTTNMPRQRSNTSQKAGELRKKALNRSRGGLARKKSTFVDFQPCILKSRTRLGQSGTDYCDQKTKTFSDRKKAWNKRHRTNMAETSAKTKDTCPVIKHDTTEYSAEPGIEKERSPVMNPASDCGMNDICLRDSLNCKPEETIQKMEVNDSFLGCTIEPNKDTATDETVSIAASDITVASSLSSLIPRDRRLSSIERDRMPAEIKRFNLRRENGETVLHRAARLGYEEAAIWCARSKYVDVNARDNAGFTPLHEAASSGHMTIARHLLAYGADINAVSSDGTRPLHDAVENDQIEMVRLLLACGAEPHLATFSEQTVFSMKQSPPMRQLLQGYMYDLNGWPTPRMDARCNFTGSTLTDDPEMEPEDDGCAIFDSGAETDSDDEEGQYIDFFMSDTPPVNTYHLHIHSQAGPRNYVRLRDIEESKHISHEEVLAAMGHIYTVKKDFVISQLNQGSVCGALELLSVVRSSWQEEEQITELDDHLAAFLNISLSSIPSTNNPIKIERSYLDEETLSAEEDFFTVEHHRTVRPRRYSYPGGYCSSGYDDDNVDEYSDGGWSDTRSCFSLMDHSDHDEVETLPYSADDERSIGSDDSDDELDQMAEQTDVDTPQYVENNADTGNVDLDHPLIVVPPDVQADSVLPAGVNENKITDDRLIMKNYYEQYVHKEGEQPYINIQPLEGTTLEQCLNTVRFDTPEKHHVPGLFTPASSQECMSSSAHAYPPSSCVVGAEQSDTGMAGSPCPLRIVDVRSYDSPTTRKMFGPEVFASPPRSTDSPVSAPGSVDIPEPPDL